MLAVVPICANCIIGPINILAGYAAACPTCSAASTATPPPPDCAAATTAGTPSTAPSAIGDNAAETDVAIPVNCAPAWEANPAKSSGGTLNGVNVSATAAAPA
ncbi:Uncharacterised protein [Mycobacterium tuberculosis]|nr:Uncharacterised protein [Mycobacterium tuberculosis]